MALTIDKSTHTHTHPKRCVFLQFTHASSTIQLQITLPLSTKLVDARVTFAQEFELSTLDKQRIFYMGRELKSNGRTLQTLGLGSFGISILHMHVLKISDSRGGRSKTAASKKRRPATTIQAGVQKRSRAPPPANNENVIELVDSEDEIEVVDG